MAILGHRSVCISILSVPNRIPHDFPVCAHICVPCSSHALYLLCMCSFLFCTCCVCAASSHDAKLFGTYLSIAQILRLACGKDMVFSRFTTPNTIKKNYSRKVVCSGCGDHQVWIWKVICLTQLGLVPTHLARIKHLWPIFWSPVIRPWNCWQPWGDTAQSDLYFPTLMIC